MRITLKVIISLKNVIDENIFYTQIHVYVYWNFTSIHYMKNVVSVCEAQLSRGFFVMIFDLVYRR